MEKATIKQTVRVLCTLAAILGSIGFFFKLLLFTIFMGSEVGWWASLPYGIGYILLGSYACYVAYLLWRRFSQRALQHFILLVVLLLPEILQRIHFHLYLSEDSNLQWYTALGVTLVFYWLFSRWLFPADER